MKKTLLVGALFVLSVVVAPMGVSADTTVHIENTGPDSVNKVRLAKKSDVCDDVARAYGAATVQVS